MNQGDCLNGALTLLVKSEVLKVEDVLSAINNGGYDAVFKLIEDKYEEIMTTQ